MKYLLIKARDSRDGVNAWWLLRGHGSYTEYAYLGAAPTENIGAVAARVKHITIVKPEFYIFSDITGFNKHADPQRRSVGSWETPHDQIEQQ